MLPVTKGTKILFDGYLITPEEKELANISIRFLKGSGILDQLEKSNSTHSRLEGELDAS